MDDKQYLHLLITTYPDKPWDFRMLSSNPGITLEFIDENPNLPWSIYDLSSNPRVPFKDIYENPDLPWNFKQISKKYI